MSRRGSGRRKKAPSGQRATPLTHVVSDDFRRAVERDFITPRKRTVTERDISGSPDTSLLESTLSPSPKRSKLTHRDRHIYERQIRTLKDQVHSQEDELEEAHLELAKARTENLRRLSVRGIGSDTGTGSVDGYEFDLGLGLGLDPPPPHSAVGDADADADSDAADAVFVLSPEHLSHTNPQRNRNRNRNRNGNRNGNVPIPMMLGHRTQEEGGVIEFEPLTPSESDDDDDDDDSELATLTESEGESPISTNESESKFMRDSGLGLGRPERRRRSRRRERKRRRRKSRKSRKGSGPEIQTESENESESESESESLQVAYQKLLRTYESTHARLHETQLELIQTKSNCKCGHIGCSSAAPNGIATTTGTATANAPSAPVLQTPQRPLRIPIPLTMTAAIGVGSAPVTPSAYVSPNKVDAAKVQLKTENKHLRHKIQTLQNFMGDSYGEGGCSSVRSDYEALRSQMAQLVRSKMDISEKNRILSLQVDRLRKKVENVKILKVEIVGLRQKEEKLREMIEEVERVRAEAALWKSKVVEWQEAFPTETAQSVSAFLVKLQSENQTMNGKMNKSVFERLEAERTLQRKNDELEAEREDSSTLRDSISSLQEEKCALEVELHRLKRENEKKDELMETYQIEEVKYMEYVKTERVRKKEARIEQLTNIGQKMKAEIVRLKSVIEERDREIASGQDKVSALKTAMQAAVCEAANCRKEVDRLEATFSTPVRVMHLVKNPISERLDPSPKPRALTSEEESSLHEKCREDLERERRRRPRQVTLLDTRFRDYVEMFRKLMYILMGYDVVKMASDTENISRYRLSSHFAKNKSDFLIVSFDNGTIGLQETEFREALGRSHSKALSYLTGPDRNYAPFFAQLTLDLFHDRRKDTTFVSSLEDVGAAESLHSPVRSRTRSLSPSSEESSRPKRKKPKRVVRRRLRRPVKSEDQDS